MMQKSAPTTLEARENNLLEESVYLDELFMEIAASGNKDEAANVRPLLDDVQSRMRSRVQDLDILCSLATELPKEAFTIPAKGERPTSIHWRALLDDDSGRKYYHNLQTGDTQWDPPGTFSVQAGPPKEPPLVEASKPATIETSSGYVTKTVPVQQVKPSAPPAEDMYRKKAPSEPALPSGWKAYTDDSGRKYYHNSLSQQTTWTLPGSSGPPPPPSKEAILKELQNAKQEFRDLKSQGKLTKDKLKQLHGRVGSLKKVAQETGAEP